MNTRLMRCYVGLAMLSATAANLVGCGDSNAPKSSVSMSVGVPEGVSKAFVVGDALQLRIVADGKSSQSATGTANIVAGAGGKPTVAATDLKLVLDAGEHTLSVIYEKNQDGCGLVELAHTTTVLVIVAANQDTLADFSRASLIYEDTDKDGYSNLGEVLALTEACDATRKPSAPAVVTYSPTSASTQVALDAPIIVVFSTMIDLATINGNTFSVIDQNGNAVDGHASVDELSAFRVKFTPVQNFASDSSYTVRLTDGVHDTTGVSIKTPNPWTFSTGATVVQAPSDPNKPDTVAPSIVAFQPVADGVNIAVATVVKVTFSEAIDSASAKAGVTVTDEAGNNIVGNVTVSGSEVTFTPSSPWAFSAKYNISITTAIKDVRGNAVGNGKSWSFTTVAAPETPQPPAPLSVVNVQPVDKATGVAVASSVIVTFSTNVDAASVTATSVHVEDSNKNSVPATSTVSGNVVTLKPQVSWAPNSVYKVFVATTVAASGGGTLAQEFSSTFDTTPPAPSNALVDYAISREVSVARLPTELSINSVVSREVSVGRQP